MELGLSRRRGFTFIEVMFSVIILGFGVIMVAVMIPVAVRQTQETRDLNAGNAVVESGFHNLETVWAGYGRTAQTSALGGALPATNFTGPANLQGRQMVVTLPSYGWQETWLDGQTDADSDGFSDAQETVAGTDPNDDTSFPVPSLLAQTIGNRIESMTAQTAWIPFYSREGTLFPYISVLGVRTRNVPAFAQEHFYNPADATEAYLDNCPLPVAFEIDQRAPFTGTSAKDEYEQDALAPAPDGVAVEHIEPTVLRISPLASGPGALPPEQIQQAAVEGAVLVAVNGRGQIRILTLSKPRTDISLDHWELEPGSEIGVKRTTAVGAGQYVHEFEIDPTGTSDEEPVRAYLVGRILKDPQQPWDQNDNPYIGPTQVIQILEGKMLR